MRFKHTMMMVTTKCNYRCNYCSMWKFKPKKDMTLEVLDKTIKKMKEFKIKFIGITGGEPTLNPNLPEIVKKLKDNGFIVGIATNGRYYDYEKIKDIDQIQISLDSVNPEKMDRWRGVNGAWKASIDSINRAKSVGIKSVIANTVVSEENVNDLEELCDFVSNKLKIRLGVCDPNFVSNDSFAFKTKKSLSPEFYKFWDRLIEAYDKYKFADAKDIFVETSRFWKKEKRTFPCLGGFATFNISVDGVFYPCFARNEIMNKPTYNECFKCTIGCFWSPSMIYYQLRHEPIKAIKNIFWYGKIWIKS